MSGVSRILIVDDNVEIHEDFKRILHTKASNPVFSAFCQSLFGESFDESFTPSLPRYELDFALQGQVAFDLVLKSYQEQRPYAMIFMDIRMPPGSDGIQTIKRIWAKHPEIEVIICTAYSDYSWKEIVAELGTTDRLLFLRKPFDPTAVKQMALSLTKKWELAQREKQYIQQLENEIAEREKSQQKMRHLALHDQLTGLPNRLFFFQKVEEVIASTENDEPFAIFFIDLNRFREVNETLGYEIGDHILCAIGERLRQCSLPGSFSARLGNDEFAVLIPQLNASEHVESLIPILKARLEKTLHFEELLIELQVTIGAVVYPVHGSSAKTLMRRADLTKTYAQNREKGFVVFAEKLDSFDPKRVTLLGDLRRAIQNDDLQLHFQPKINLQSKSLAGVEALVRWKHPTYGNITPLEFVNLAERCGMIKALSLWVLQAVLKQWQLWFQAGLEVVVSINMSAKDLIEPSLPKRLSTLLTEYQVPPSFVVIEITESAMMLEPEMVHFNMAQMRASGIQIAIDDFGVGYSSLGYLKNLPVDELKIDKSFVLDMLKANSNIALVKTAIEIGHTLGLRVVAEGVESPEVKEQLETMGCDLAQGYLFSKPLPPDEFFVWANSEHLVG